MFICNIRFKFTDGEICWNLHSLEDYGKLSFIATFYVYVLYASFRFYSVKFSNEYHLIKGKTYFIQRNSTIERKNK